MSPKRGTIPRRADWLTEWLIDWLTAWLIEWWLIDCLIDWFAAWLADCPTDWVTDWQPVSCKVTCTRTRSNPYSDRVQMWLAGWQAVGWENLYECPLQVCSRISPVKAYFRRRELRTAVSVSILNVYRDRGEGQKPKGIRTWCTVQTRQSITEYRVLETHTGCFKPSRESRSQRTCHW